MAHHRSPNLLASTQVLLRGLTLHGKWITAPDDAPSILESKLHRFQEAISGADAAQSTKEMANKRLMVADRALKNWLTKARLVVMLARGARWSESWVNTGFVDRRTHVPKRMESRISLARALVTFFARHPELGVPFAEVTAARGRAICERAAQSNEMLELAKKDCLVMTQERRLAENDLRSAMRKVTDWLKSRLDPSDSRWADFGIVVSMRRTGGRGRLTRRRVAAIQLAHSTPDRHHIAAA